MEKLIDSFSGFVDKKLKNPFINTFLISWFAFNWKPIVFFIFSKETAETKIWFITARYSDLSKIILYPATWTVFIMIFIPFILLLLNKYPLAFINKNQRSVKEKIQIDDIISEGEIAKEKNKTEDFVLAARKIGDVNQHITNLNEKLKLAVENLQNEEAKNIELTRKYRDDIAFIKSAQNSDIEKIRQLELEVLHYKQSVETEREISKNNEKRYNDIYQENQDNKEKLISLIADTKKPSVKNLYNSDQGEVLEYTDGNKHIIFSVNLNRLLNADEISEYFHNSSTKLIMSQDEIEKKVNLFQNWKSAQN